VEKAIYTDRKVDK